MNNVVSLEELFHRRVFEIPDYQRGYSWEHHHVREFLEDLELLAPSRYHYTGTIVLHPKSSTSCRMDTAGKSHDAVSVVDGQQRLTTVVILLDGICRSLSTLSEEAKTLALGIRTNFIAATEVNGQPLHKLILNGDTNHFFENTILSKTPSVEGPTITSERRLLAAKKTVQEYLSLHPIVDKKERIKWLQTLYMKVSTQLRFSLYQVEDEAEVGVIFEVMNDRGKPLTDLEKVKNYLLHISTRFEATNDLAATVNAAWAEILRRLMHSGLVSSADEDRLLRSHWLAYYNPQSRQWEGSKSVKATFALKNYRDKHAELLRQLHIYTSGLRESCIGFCDAFHPTARHAFEVYKFSPDSRDQVIAWSDRLNRIGVLATFLPLLIVSRKRWPDDPEKYLELLKLCEIFAFRVYRLNESKANAGQAALFRLAYRIAKDNCEFVAALLTIKAEIARRCDNEEFERLTTAENAADNPYEWYRWRGLRYFLYEYESHLASKQGASPIVAWNDINNSDLKDTIEHVLPQSIEGKRYWTRRFPKKRHGRYVHDLGNLTLTKHNSHFSNKPFPKKKGSVDYDGHCYAKSPLYIERELVEWDEWNAEAIDARRTRLLEWAQSRWAIELDELDDVQAETELENDEADDTEDFADEDDERD